MYNLLNFMKEKFYIFPFYLNYAIKYIHIITLTLTKITFDILSNIYYQYTYNLYMYISFELLIFRKIFFLTQHYNIYLCIF